MGVVGTVAIVDALISSLWGVLFSKSRSRDYYNFIGEVANRSLSPRHVKVVETAIKNNFPGTQVRTRTGEYEDVKFNNPLGNGKSTPTDTKFRLQDPYYVNQNNQNNNNNKNQKKKDKKKGKNFSACPNLLKITSEHDFSFRDWVERVKSIFSLKEKKAAQQEVLLGCYEYLEDNGYDAYPVMLDILNRKVEEKNFSEDEYPISEEEISGFVDAVKKYKSLENGERAEVDRVLKEKFGEEGYPLFSDAVGKYSSKSLTKGDMWFLKVIGILGAVITLFRVIFPPRQKPDVSDVTVTRY